MSDLHADWSSGGLTTAVEGNSPILIAESGAVWLVLAGQVHLFATQVQDGEPVGPRIYLFSAQPDEALFGIDPTVSGGDFALLAVGVPGTRLVKVTLEQV